jgi:hypothetical protein
MTFAWVVFRLSRIAWIGAEFLHGGTSTGRDAKSFFKSFSNTREATIADPVKFTDAKAFLIPSICHP